MSDNRISSTKSTPYTSSTSATSSAGEAKAVEQSAPMSKSADATLANSYFTQDEVVDGRKEENAFLAKQENFSRKLDDSRPSFSARDLAMGAADKTQAKKGLSEGAQETLSELTDALSNPANFDAETCKSKSDIGTQLNTSVFDKHGSSVEFHREVRELLDNPEKTRAAISASLSHLPPAERKEATDHVMEKLGDKLCGRIQQEMQREIDAKCDLATQALEPFCGEKNTANRMALVDGLIHHKPALSQSQMSERLQRVGITPDDAKDITARICEAQGNSNMMGALSQAVRNEDYSAEVWEKGILLDGAMRNLDDALRDAFDDTRENIATVKNQMASDRADNEGAFTNPLFDQARESAMKKYGVPTGKEAKSSASGQLVDQRIEQRKSRELKDTLASAGVVAIASIIVPGGLAVTLGTGTVSSAPGVMIAQKNLDASRGGVHAGTNDQKLADKNETSRNVEVGLAVFGLVLGGIGSKGKVVDSSALEGAVKEASINSSREYVLDNLAGGAVEAGKAAATTYGPMYIGEQLKE